MANNIPTQSRSIDPYSSYNSNIVNELTRMVTRGVDCIHGTHSLDLTIDSTSPTTCLILSPGICYKDDVIIQITEEFIVEMHDNADLYLTNNIFDEAGYYYVVLNYSYIKSKPAPQASILILKPSQTSSYNSTSFLFLKCVKVDWNDPVFEIDTVYDYDPDNPEIKRTYVQSYFGVEDSLPVFDRERDEGRAIYVESSDAVYYGGHSGWIGYDVVKDSMDTVGCPVGSLVYINVSLDCGLAIATAVETFAVAVVMQEGLVADKSGKIKLFGRCDDVPVEAGRTLTAGNRLYLSETQAGSVTPFIPEPYGQFVGTCISFDAGESTCSMFFNPSGGGGGSGGGGSDTSLNPFDTYTDLLSQSIFCNLTIDTFSNDDYVDTANTTATVDSLEYKITGTVGELFYSTNLAEVGYASLINQCQVSATMEYSWVISWFVSNHGNIEVEYEPITIDTVHLFSEVYIPIGAVTGASFEIGEIVTGGTSLNTGIVCGVTSGTCILLRNVVGTGTFTNPETLIGTNTGAICTTTGSQTDRTTSSYNSLSVKAVFSGDGVIKDYGVLYKDDLELVGYFQIQGGIGDFVDLDVTPNIFNYRVWRTTSSGTPFDITNFDNAYDGKEITIVFTSNEVTIKHNSNIILSTGLDLLGSQNDVISLIYNQSSNVWIEKSRS